MSWLRALAVAIIAALSLSAQQSSALDPFAIQGDSAIEASFSPTVGAYGSVDAPVEDDKRFSTAIEIALLLTALSVLPALLISLTCFTRIVVVLSFVRRSMAVNELPPNPILIGLAMFLTTFVMAPIIERIYDEAYLPYSEGQVELSESVETGWGVLRGFLLANTRASELTLFADISGVAPGDIEIAEADLPFQVVIPAFVLSELKTAFQMGFLLFLPFLVIDLVVASILISMGMFMLPPVMISTPFKILLFVLVDGWHLVCESLVTSFITS